MSQFVEYKFDQEDWQRSEVQVSAFDKSVLECLKNLGGGKIDYESELKLMPVSGDDIYVSTRDTLSKWNGISLLYEDYMADNYNSKIIKIIKKSMKTENKENMVDMIDQYVDKIYQLSYIPNYIEKFLKSDVYTLLIKMASDGLTNFSPKVVNNDNVYMKLKTKLMNLKELVSKKNEKKKLIKKIDIMRMENLQSKYVNELGGLLETFDKDNMNVTYGFSQYRIIEHIGITFMYAIWFILNHTDKYKKRSKLVDVYEIIVAAQRFLQSIKTYEGRSMHNSLNREKPSNVLINDLSQWIEEIMTAYEFDGFKIYDLAPKLFVYTNYDHVIPQKDIRPRKNQLDLVRTLNDNLNNKPNDGLLLILKAPIGSGKTFSAVAIVSLMRAHKEKTKNKGYSKCELIFCCNLRSVKNQVANLAYNSDIKFGVGFMNGENVRIVNHFTCKSDNDRELIICSPDVAETLLKHNKNKYWLFLDEPTVGADQCDSDSLKKNVAVMLNMPKYTILSSATMPNFENLNKLLDIHKIVYPNVELATVYSGEIQIGCDVKLHNNQMVLPHLLCKSSGQLGMIIDTVEKNPFLGRMYTYHVVRELWNALHKQIKNVPNLKSLFSNVNNLSSDKIRLVAIDMLKKMMELDDNKIEKICSINMTDNTNYEKDNNDNSDIAFGDEDNGEEEINYKYLGTKQAYRFLNMNLIADVDPVNFSLTYFSDLLNDLKDAGYASSSKIVEKHFYEMDNYNKIMEKIKDNVIKHDTNSKDVQQVINGNIHDFKDNLAGRRRDVMDIFDSKMSKNESSGKKHVDEKNSHMLEKYEQSRPKIDFPLWGQINTYEHIKYYSKNYLKTINPRSIRPHFDLESMPLNTSVPDQILLLLMCGIGIYSPNNPSLDYKYTRYVLDMAESGRLAYLVADSSISYGTNYPIVRLFVTDEFARQHSVNTLLQLMGRPGRVGQSYKAEVYVGSYTAKTLIEYSHDPNCDNGIKEAINIADMMDKILMKKN